MSDPRGLGLSLGSVRLPLLAQSELASWCESAGADSFWISEVRSQDALVHAMDVVARTEHITVGTAVVSVFSRATTLLAMAAATLQDLSGGRFVLGIGPSSPQVTTDWMGVPFLRPLSRVRDTLDILMTVRQGRPVFSQGEAGEIRGFRLGLPAVHVPILLGATGPAMLELAGSQADGVVASTFIAAETMGDWLEPFHRAQAGTRSSVVAKTFIALLDDEPARSRMRRFIGSYLTAPAYNASMSAHGFAEEAAALLKAGGDRAAIEAAVSDRLFTALVAGPGESSMAARIARLRAAGATDVVLEPIGDAETPEETAALVRECLASAYAPQPAEQAARG